MKKIKISSELFYILAVLIIAFSVAMVAAADFGVSMIVAPAYIVSLKFDFLTFGQAEYVVQGMLFIVLCIVLKKFKLLYAQSFLTGVFYGAVLDLFRKIIPHFNMDLHPAGSLPIWLRIIYYVCGTVMTSISIAMFFKTYLFPQVYDFFVKAVTIKYNLKLSKFKTCYDATFLTVSVILTLVFFHKFNGIGVGTIITTIVNGTLIGFFSKQIDKWFDVQPRFKKFSKNFELE